MRWGGDQACMVSAVCVLWSEQGPQWEPPASGEEPRSWGRGLRGRQGCRWAGHAVGLAGLWWMPLSERNLVGLAWGR